MNMKCPHCGYKWTLVGPGCETVEIYAQREMELAKLVLDKRMSLNKIAQLKKRTRNHLAREICFGAYMMSNKEAKRLSELSRTKGIGSIGAIKRYLAKTVP